MDKEHFCNDKFVTCKLFNDKSAPGLIDVQNFINIKNQESGKVVYGNLDICGWVIIKKNNIYVEKNARKCINELQQINEEEIINGQIVWFHYVRINKDKHSLWIYISWQNMFDMQ